MQRVWHKKGKNCLIFAFCFFVSEKGVQEEREERYTGGKNGEEAEGEEGQRRRRATPVLTTFL